MKLRLSHAVIGVALLLATTSSSHAQVQVADDLGRLVVLPAEPRRIVSLAPSITETFYAIGAGEQVVGVTDFCNYPPEAAQKPRIGGITNPSIETIIALKPDLIVVSVEGNVRDDFEKLLSVGVPVFVTNPRTLSGIHKSILDLGVLAGKRSGALRLVGKMQQCEDSIRALTKTEKRTLLLVSTQPLIAVGSKTFLAELLQLAGGKNIAGTTLSTYPTLSREFVVAENPDVIIVMSDVLTATSELPGLFPEWNSLKALLHHQVFRINSDLVSRPGPRATDGLVALYRILHAHPPGGQEEQE